MLGFRVPGRVEYAAAMSKLVEIIEQLSDYDPELTIYAKEPWTPTSEALVDEDPEDGGLPASAQSKGLSYFLEVFIATEFIEGWLSTRTRPVSPREQCERLVQYAVNDA
jgi:hypothetical protein